MMTINAGKYWEMDCKVQAICEKGGVKYVTLNFNKGCIIVVEVYNDVIMAAWYDGLGGPLVKWDRCYIWNSMKESTTGKKKQTFTISKKQVEEVIKEYYFRQKLKMELGDNIL